MAKKIFTLHGKERKSLTNSRECFMSYWTTSYLPRLYLAEVFRCSSGWRPQSVLLANRCPPTERPGPPPSPATPAPAVKPLKGTVQGLACTVSRAICIWKNENGSCEAGPNSKYWWSFIAGMVLSQSVELMTDNVLLHCNRSMKLK